MLDINTIINNTKKDFTRDRSSAINNFLINNSDAVIISYIKKARGDAIKFYYIKNDKKTSSEYVLKNAKTLIKAFIKNNVKLYIFNNGDIKEYNDDFLKES